MGNSLHRRGRRWSLLLLEYHWFTRSASSSTPPGKILEIRPVAGTTGKQAWRPVTGALPGTRYTHNRGWQIFFYDDGERVHAYTLHAHNLFDGKGCMHAPSCHHHVSRISTGQEVHAHPFSQYAFCIMAAVSRCWWWRGGIYMHPRPAFFSSFLFLF